MIVRKIREEELKRTAELFSVAFEFACENAGETPEETAARCRERPTNRIQKHAFEKWAAFEDDDKTMMAFIGGTPYEVEFDGSTVKMSGVGGVSSLAQYRRQGAIRGCFEKYLRDLYEDGYVFSTLYPFSASYYRKFGYECGELLTTYQISLPAIPKFGVGGGARLVEHGSCLKDVERVYDVFRQGLNMAAAREDLDYDWVCGANPAKSCQYVYVYYNAEGVPKGVMAFTKDSLGDPPSKENPRFHMNCQHFFFSDLEGFKGLLNHCKAFEMYYDFITFRLPRHMRAEHLIPERSFRTPLYIRQNMNGMVRVINVKRALELARYRGSGELSIRVKDGMLPKNDGCFRAVFENDQAVSVERIGCGTPDAELDITDFSRFLLGTHTPEEMAYVETAAFHAPLERIAKVFYKKPIYITEDF